MKKFLFIIFSLVLLPKAQEIGARYLIITHDNFYNYIIPLARWKYKKGMRTKIVKLSQIGNTATQIRDFIVSAYNNWQIKPEYILFVGAPNFIPFPLVLGWNSDNYYTNVSGDLHNEILSGRLTVRDTNEIQTVVQKILAYERTPNTTDTMWFKKACLIANEDYGIYPPIGNDTVYWNDVRYAKNLMLDNGYTLVDTLSAGLGNNAYNVYQSINNGRGFLMYRGTGLGNWYNPFACDADNTTNGTKLPVVLSMTCRTVGTGSTPAEAEKWFLTGTPTNLRGGAGFFATTTVGEGFITFLRSAVSRGFFDALFIEGKTTFGEACEGGRKRVYSLYPYSGGDEEYVGFTTVGDPEMSIWTASPCSLVVIHPQLIPFGSASFSVNVYKATGSIPVENAFVCIAGKQDTNVYSLDTTDAAGNAHFTINPLIVGDTIYVTVTGKNLKPYEGFMIVSYTENPYVIYLKSIIDDSLYGNNNHFINPGETINLPLWVRNWGDSTAYDVIGILRTSDSYVTFFDSVKSFGNINGADSAFTGNAGYEFLINKECPDMHLINFEMCCQDHYDSTWISYFSYSVYAPLLVFQEARISGGNGNISIEPGETVFVKVLLKNSGHSPVDSVNAILKSLSNYIEIIDSLGNYGHIGPDSTLLNDSNPFVVSADSSTPQGTIANFQIILSAQLYQDTISFSLSIGAKDYYLWNPAINQQPGLNIHNILSDIGYLGDIGTNLPDDLQYYNSIFVCLGVFPNNYVILNNSNEAIMLTSFANNGGSLYMEGGDVWYYDPTIGGHDFSNLFGLYPESDGQSDLGPVSGIPGTFTNSMFFNYTGENDWIDHINPASPGSFLIFRDADNYYNCGVAYDAGTYRTVGTSFELGMLVDDIPPSTRAALLDSIMHFFGFSHGITEKDKITIQKSEISLQIYPNPFRNNLVIKFQLPILNQVQDKSQTELISIKIYDVSGRLVKQFNHLTIQPFNRLVWCGDDNSGRKLPAGIYFIKLDHNGIKKVEKAVLLK
ncbi:MAG: C25 family cysteine peptidase [bacterium]